MPRKILRKYLPKKEALRNHRVLRLFGEALFRPELWRLHRNNVAKGVAIGMFCGLIPGPFQVIGATVSALWLKANLPIAILTTFYTNPVTIIPLYLIAYKLGNIILNANHLNLTQPPPDWVWTEPFSSAKLLLEWIITLGPTLALGVLILAILLAFVGYLLVYSLWSLNIRLRHWRRKKRHKPYP